MNLKYKENELLIILGVIPFIALTDSALNGLGIGMIVLITIFFSVLICSLTIVNIKEPERTLICIIINATIVSILGSLLSHKFSELYSNIGIFLPLVAVNSFVFKKIQSFENKYSGIRRGFLAVKDYLMGIFILFIAGAIREISGKGMLLNKNLMSPDSETTIILFFNTPAGALIATGIVVCFYRLLKKKNGL
uniref:Electron transport complex subunit RsxE n=1 Tax=candidate division WOR-3 bacterium TaxID=2052148 RepID=A0A7V1EH02_UNCW3